MAGSPGTLRVLCLCSANRCRSPMAAGLLITRLGPSAGVEVTSAGFGPAGEPVLPEAARVMSELGIDIGDHRSRTVTPEMIVASGLAVTMTATQAVEALAMAPEAWTRVYPIAELVRRGRLQSAPAPGQDLQDWLRTVAAERTPAELLGAERRYDIRDPTGGPLRGFRHTRDLLAAALDPLADWLSAAGSRPGERS